MRLFSRFSLYFFVGVFLVIGLSLNVAGVAQDLNADSLNQKGFSLLNQGEAAEAFSIWKEAEDTYRAEGDNEGVIGTQLNQSLAQQALGLNPLACQTLTDALEVSRELCSPNVGISLIVSELAAVEVSPVTTLGIRLLGESLGLVSNLEESTAALLIAQDRSGGFSAEELSITLALANSYRLSFQAAWQNYARLSYRDIALRSHELSEAVSFSEQAIRSYENVSNSGDRELSAKADLNIIGLLAYVLENESDLNSATNQLIERLIQAAQQSYQHLETTDFDFSQLPAIDRVYTALNLATNLSTVKASRYGQRFDTLMSSVSSDLIEKSAILAEAIGSRRALSAAYGTAGNHLRNEGESISLIREQYRKALSIAQSIQADDMSYQWAYQLAQLEQESGDLPQAQQYYELSLVALSNVRSDLLAVDSEIRFNFRSKVEPVYKGYMQLLASQQKADLQRIVEIHSSFQLAQIENLLRCGRLVLSDSKKLTVHLIDLSNTIEVIISTDDQTYGYSVPSTEILADLESLASNVRSPRFLDIPESEFLPYAQSLYDKLLRPAMQDGVLLKDSEISFVLDSPFQSIPIGLLHDGEQYLAVSHPLSVSFENEEVPEPAVNAEVLFAGLSESSPSFNDVSEFGELEPLLDTEFEASYVSKYIESGTQILLNQQFTADNLMSKVSQADFEIVHISTHSQFSSDPAATFLLAWDRPIDAIELEEIFQQAKSIDLLFLSACQTAAGDDRSALGLAGLSIQSGARNAVASLWLVDSVAASVFVDSFYEALSDDVGPAKALQQAQISLINSAGEAFKHPYYWAPFILAAS